MVRLGRAAFAALVVSIGVASAQPARAQDVDFTGQWVPIFHEDFYTVHSQRLAGAENYFVSPTHIPIYYEMLYATDAQ